MRYVATCVCLAIGAACAGSNSSHETSDAVPFLEGLEVSESAPIEVRCRAEIGTMTHSFGTKQEFEKHYQSMRRGFQDAENVSLGGPVFNASLAESCEITHEGRVLDSWARE